MRHLVTGGAGFIGSHLVEALLARGHQVVVLDDFSSGHAANLAACRQHDGLSVVQGSVCDPELVASCLVGVDQVVHLAAAVGVRRILREQVSGIRTNIRGTEVVLEACAAQRIPVLLASTSEVYGKSAATPFAEDTDCVLGASSLHRWSYACSKLVDEFIALAYWREHGLPVVIARFFNVTGPRQSPRYGMVLPRFCQAAVAGGTLEVHGDGAQSRCFLHIDDCIAALLALLAEPRAIGEVVNVGSTEETSILALAERVIAQSGGAAGLRLVPYAEAYAEGGFEDMRRRVPDLAKLRRLTGWAPRHDLDATIRAALGWAGGSGQPLQPMAEGAPTAAAAVAARCA